MAGKQFDEKFMGNSKDIFEDSPEFKKKLEKTMGRVADSIVKKKYVKTKESRDQKKISKDENNE